MLNRPTKPKEKAWLKANRLSIDCWRPPSTRTTRRKMERKRLSSAECDRGADQHQNNVSKWREKELFAKELLDISLAFSAVIDAEGNVSTKPLKTNSNNSPQVNSGSSSPRKSSRPGSGNSSPRKRESNKSSSGHSSPRKRDEKDEPTDSLRTLDAILSPRKQKSEKKSVQSLAKRTMTASGSEIVKVFFLRVCFPTGLIRLDLTLCPLGVNGVVALSAAIPQKAVDIDRKIVIANNRSFCFRFFGRI